MIRHLRPFVRIIFFGVLMTSLSMVVPLVRIFSDSKIAFSIHRQGMLLMHKILGIRLNVIGELPNKPALIMCNHPSYFDIFFNIGKHPAVMVVGHQFKKWPFVGWLGIALNTIWVNRNNSGARKKARKDISQTIEKGLCVFICPEGRTAGSHYIQEVNPALFHDACEKRIPIVFYSFWYHSSEFPYFHDLKSGFLIHLFHHLWRALQNEFVVVDMKVSAPRNIESAKKGMNDFYRFNRWHLRNSKDLKNIVNTNIAL